MFFKRKEYFLLIIIILLQSCTGGRVGNFLESSFDDLEKTNRKEESKKVLETKKFFNEKESEINQNIENKNKEKKTKEILVGEKVSDNEKESEINQNIENKKKEEKTKKILVKKKVSDNEKKLVQTKKTIKDKKPRENKKKDPQSYKVIFILKDVDPKDPTKEISSFLRNSKVNFEIEKIERFFDSENKNMKKTY